MIICTSCGTRNEDGESFCGECGAYLEWEGERLAEPEPEPVPVAEPEPEPEPAAPSFVQRVRTAVGIGADAAPADAAPAQAAPADAPPARARHAAPPSAGTDSAGIDSADGTVPDAATPAAPPAADSTATAGPAPAGTANPTVTTATVDGTVDAVTASPRAAAPLVVPLAPAAPEDHAPPAGSDAIAVRRPGQPAPKPATTAPTTAPAIAATTAPGTGPVPPGAPSQPKAVRPGAAAPKPRRRELPQEERPPAPGETICGSCGAGNAPTRKFCRRCGTDLADAVVAGRPPWWKRLFAGRQHAAPVAGARPKYKRKRSFRGLAWLVGVIVVLGVAAVATRPYWSSASNSVLDRVQGTKIVNPTSFTASSAAKGHGAANIRDGAPNVYWAPAGAGAKAIGQSVSVGFASPFRLVYLRVFDGASDQLKDYLAASSAQQIEVTLTQKGGGHVVKRFTLNDKPGSQDLHVAVDNVTGAQVTIESIYTHDKTSSAGALVAIGELEFLARK